MELLFQLLFVVLYMGADVCSNRRVSYDTSVAYIRFYGVLLLLVTVYFSMNGDYDYDCVLRVSR